MTTPPGTPGTPQAGRPPPVRLAPWSQAGLELLHRQNTAAMTAHLNGPETEAQVADRHRRYLVSSRHERMFLVYAMPGGELAGSTGHWELTVPEGRAYETGYAVLPAFQGRGLAVAAVRAVLGLLAAQEGHRFVHAYPSVANGPSNAVCRQAGFTLAGEHLTVFRGRALRCHDWRFDLRGPAAGASGGPASARGGGR